MNNHVSATDPLLVFENRARNQRVTQRSQQQRQHILEWTIVNGILLKPIIVIILQYEPRIELLPPLQSSLWIDSQTRKEKFQKMTTRRLKLTKWGVIPGLGRHAVLRIMKQTTIRTFNQLLGMYFMFERNNSHFQDWLQQYLKLEQSSAHTLTEAIHTKVSTYCDHDSVDASEYDDD
jgi:hypothetical protein